MSAREQRASRRGLAADREGTAAVEFALLFPILLTLFFGSYELENYLLANLKVTAAAETAADLVAQTGISGGSLQTGVLQPTDFASFTDAAAAVLTPLPTSNNQVKVAYASVTYSTGVPVIDWHVEENGATPITTGNVPHNQSLANLGNAAAGSTDSVIVVQVQYAYTSPLTYVLSSSYAISEAAFNRPRYVNCVPSYQNSGSVCP